MVKLTTFPDTAQVKELQSGYRQLLDRVKKTRKPLFVMTNNVPDVVMLDMQSWDEIVKRIQVEEIKQAKQAIDSYKKAKKTGKLVKFKGDLASLLH